MIPTENNLLISYREITRMRPFLLLLSGLFFVVAGGCNSIPSTELEVAEDAGEETEAAEEESAEESIFAIRNQNKVDRAELLDETPLKVDDIVPEDVAVLQDAIVVPERKPLVKPTRMVSEYPRDLIQGMKDPEEEVEVEFSLDAMPLSEVVPLFAALLDFSYIVDPGVKGAVTMTVESTMKGEDVWELFEHVLWLSGAYASPNPGFIHVLPFSKMATERRLLTKHKPQPNVHVQLVPVFNMPSAEMAGVLQQFMTPGATAHNIPRLNSLLIVEAPLNMPKLLELVEILDSPGEAMWPQITIRCNEVDAETILEELEALMPILGFPTSKQSPSNGALKMTALPRMQVIVASAALEGVLNEVEKWARMLDRADASDKEDIFFYNVRHGTAQTLSEMLGVFFNASATTATRRSRTDATSTRAQDTRNRGNTTRQPATRETPSAPRTSSQVREPENDSIFETPVVVYVDEIQNRLTIRTTARAYAAVRALLERQDVPVRQVMIEAVIAEITLGKSTEFGFAYAAKHGDWWYGYNGTDRGIGTQLPAAGDEWNPANTFSINDTWTETEEDDGEGGTTTVRSKTTTKTSNFRSRSGNIYDYSETLTDGVADAVSKSLTTAADLYNFSLDGGLLGSGVAALNLKDDALSFITAVAGDSNTKVLSAPQIMAATGEEARIEVGKEVAVRTSGYVDSSSGSTIDDTRVTYEYKNTGTILTVTPQITAGNQVRVEIEQEVSSVVEATRAELDSPDISRKNLRTTLTIPDGGTIMMGGLIDTLRGESHSGVPFFKDIPYIGWLFRSNRNTSSRQELLVLITVHVVDPSDPSSTEQLAARYQAALEEIRHQFEDHEYE